MKEIEPYKIISLAAKHSAKFRGMAFDGCFFYLTEPCEYSIYKFDKKFNLIQIIKTCNSYAGICYDSKENCFWAFTEKDPHCIHKLDCTLKKSDLIQLNSETTCLPILGLSYDCDSNKLIAAYNDHIAKITKEGFSSCILKEDCKGDYEAVLSITPYYAVVHKTKRTQQINFYNKENCMIKELSIPYEYCIKDILFYPCEERSKAVIDIMLLAASCDNQQRILHYKTADCDMILSCCNYEWCKCHCGNKNCKKKPCGCENEDKEKQCMCDLIESVALVETALSHILNAEGEKLQKAVELACDIDDLLEINKSVNKTLTTAVMLENALYTKLEVLNDLCRKSTMPHKCDLNCDKEH